MKRNIICKIIVFALLLMDIPCFAQHFEVKGRIHGMKEGAMVTLTRDINDTLAMTKVHDGVFSLTGKVSHPLVVLLSINDEVEYEKGRFPRQRAISFMLDGGSTTIEAPCYDSIPLRAGAHEDMVRMRKNVIVSGSPITRHYEEWIAAERDAELYPTDDNKEKARQFFSEYPDYAVSLAMADKRMGGVFVHSLHEMDSLVNVFRNNEDTLGCRLFCEKVESLRPYAKGVKYTDLAVVDVDGKERRLSEYIKPGIWNFIDLWASWCMPCRAAIPEVRKMYERAKGKVNIVSLSMDSKQVAWMKAVEEEKMPWSQVMISSSNVERARNAYKLTTIPYLVVISPEGGVEFVSKNAKSAVRKVLSLLSDAETKTSETDILK